MNPTPARPVCRIGVNALTGEPLGLTLKDLRAHFHIQGRTGRGKTRLLETMFRALAGSGRAVVLLDGKGELYQRALAWCVEQQLDERVLLIDPTDTRWAVGLNYLEPQGGADPATHAEIVMEGVKKIFGQSHELMPLLEKWLQAAALALIMKGLTIAELEAFASAAAPELREVVLRSLGEEGRELTRRWGELDAFRKSEQAMQVMAVQNRGALITASPMGQAMFGQVRTAVHWPTVIAEGGIVLIRCHEASNVSFRLCQTIGVTVVHQLLQTALSRPDGVGPDCWVIADEFQQFCCPDFARALSQLRSKRVWFVLANQFLAQLAEVPGMIESLHTNCDGKVYFSLSHLDADAVVHELFQPEIAAGTGELKHQLFQTKFRPVETVRAVRSTVRAESEATSDATTESHSAGEVVGEASGGSESFGQPGFFGADVLGTATSLVQSYASAAGRVTGFASSSSFGRSRAEGVTLAPWYEYEPFVEESSRQYLGLDEVLERLKGWLMLQSPRRAYVKLGDRRALPIVTAYVRDPVVLEDEVAEFVTAVAARYARPLAEARAEVRARVQQLLAEAAAQAMTPADVLGELAAEALPAPAADPWVPRTDVRAPAVRTRRRRE